MIPKRNIEIEVPCPTCRGDRRITLRRFNVDPQKETTLETECGCETGRVKLLVDVQVLEDAIDEALPAALTWTTRGLQKDDREFVLDDISTIEAARDILAGLDVTLSKKANSPNS